MLQQAGAPAGTVVLGSPTEAIHTHGQTKTKEHQHQ
jgi:hypothetical protein